MSDQQQLFKQPLTDDTLWDMAATLIGRLNAVADRNQPQRQPATPKPPQPAEQATRQPIQSPLVRAVPGPTRQHQPRPATAPADQLEKLLEAKEATLARLELIIRQIAHIEAQAKRAS